MPLSELTCYTDSLTATDAMGEFSAYPAALSAMTAHLLQTLSDIQFNPAKRIVFQIAFQGYYEGLNLQRQLFTNPAFLGLANQCASRVAQDLADAGQEIARLQEQKQGLEKEQAELADLTAQADALRIEIAALEQRKRQAESLPTLQALNRQLAHTRQKLQSEAAGMQERIGQAMQIEGELTDGVRDIVQSLSEVENQLNPALIRQATELARLEAEIQTKTPQYNLLHTQIEAAAAEDEFLTERLKLYVAANKKIAAAYQTGEIPEVSQKIHEVESTLSAIDRHLKLAVETRAQAQEVTREKRKPGYRPST